MTIFELVKPPALNQTAARATDLQNGEGVEWRG
jgi:hypothetical protein